MPAAWLPNSVAESIVNEAEGRREARRMVDFIRRLRAVDSRLDCWLAPRYFPDDDIRMGFYYVLRRNEDGTITFWEVSNPDGSFREPDDQVIEALRRGDANRTDLARERELQRRADARRREKRERDRLDEMHARFKDEVDYAFRVQVPVSKSVAA